MLACRANKDPAREVRVRGSCNRFNLLLLATRARVSFTSFLIPQSRGGGKELCGERRERCDSLQSKCLMIEDSLALSPLGHSSHLCHTVHKENSLKEGKMGGGRVPAATPLK
jgi:hypothetical protein